MGKNKNGRQAYKSIPKVSVDSLASMTEELGLFSPLPPNKRSELNGLVDKLKTLTVSKTKIMTPVELYKEYEEIQIIILKVQELESKNMSRRVSGNRSGYKETFIDWLKKNGAILSDSLTLTNYSDSGFGFKTIKPIKTEEIIAEIPRKLVMSVDTARDSSIGTFIEKDPILKIMNNVVLALHLLIEKNSPASFWEPYINILPKSYETVLYYTPEDFQALKGSPAFEEALKQYKFAARQYVYYYNKFQSMILKDYFTYDEYRWAVSTVMTRQNKIPSATEDSDGIRKQINALIPYWDMANHDGTIQMFSVKYDDKNDNTSCLANRDFEIGEQFTMYYGPRSNSDFLVHNGFVPTYNPDNYYSLKLGIGQNDPLRTKKIELLTKLCIQVPGMFYLMPNAESPVEESLIAFLRVNSAKTEEELSLDNPAINSIASENPFRSGDDVIWRYLKTRCDLLLKGYTTSLEVDETDLINVKNNQRKKNILILRIEEKKILKRTMEYCDTKLKEALNTEN